MRSRLQILDGSSVREMDTSLVATTSTDTSLRWKMSNVCACV